MQPTGLLTSRGSEVAHLYEVLWNNVLSCKAIGHGKEGYYFAENGEHKLYDVAKRIGVVLKDFGLANTEEPSTFSQEELDKYFYGARSPLASFQSIMTDLTCRPLV